MTKESRERERERIKEKESFEQHRSAVAYFVSIKRRKQLFFFRFPIRIINKWIRAKKKKIYIYRGALFYRIKFRALLYKRCWC